MAGPQRTGPPTRSGGRHFSQSATQSPCKTHNLPVAKSSTWMGHTPTRPYLFHRQQRLKNNVRLPQPIPASARKESLLQAIQTQQTGMVPSTSTLGQNMVVLLPE